MISSNSTWDREAAKPTVSPAFSRGVARVVYEFGNRRSQKIFSHRLGSITFRDTLGTELTESRDGVIKQTYGQRSVNGYRYKSVSHSHILPTLLNSDLDVYGHGTPVKEGYENCALIGATCADGSDTRCSVGKCVYGHLTQVSGDKWRYDSYTVPDLYYFVYGTESVTLRSITRGVFKLPAGAGTVDVDKPASLSTTVYLPPKTYTAETFVRRVVVAYHDAGDVRSLTDSVDNFIRALLGRNYAEVPVEVEIRDRVLGAVKSVLLTSWHTVVDEQIDAVWRQRYEGADLTNRDFMVACYGVLTTLYESGLQVALSGIKASRVNADNRAGRPVYERLPGVSGAYNDEGQDTVAKWLTAGSDTELSGSKYLIDTFYRNYLDPDTCYPLNLDWLAQHYGFTSNLWDNSWPAKVKRTLLQNAHVNKVTGSLWTTDPDQDTLRKIDFAWIERSAVDTVTGEVSLAYRYSGKEYDAVSGLTTISTSNNLVIDSSAWQGVLPSRGSMVTLLFMFWVFGIKAHTPSELRYDSSDNTYVVRSGLRSNESVAPVNTPYVVDVLKVGSDTDAEVGTYPNQLIADIGTCQDKTSANTVVIRMPFYYNRNGRSWDAASRIVENYVPSTSIKRLQYAYAAADLLVADDVFFEPVL